MTESGTPKREATVGYDYLTEWAFLVRTGVWPDEYAAELTAAATADRYVAEILTMINEDIVSGTVPRTVASFSELHSYVDANTYTIDADVPYDLMADGGMDLVHDVEARVGRALAANIHNDDLDGEC